MEFLRFGSNIPGGYWGCCACCIIQDFKQMPTDKASIQIVSGDTGQAFVQDGGSLYAGPTYEDIFETRIRIGTFSNREMPNHAFFAILTENQLKGTIGKAWLPILKKHGFEFIRAVCNSVYGGASINSKMPSTGGAYQNYIFGLFRNIGNQALPNPFQAPQEWTALEGSPELIGLIDVKAQKKLAAAQFDFQLASWKKGKTKFVTEKELLAAGAPIIKAGVRGGALPKNITAEVKKSASPEQVAPEEGAAKLAT